MPQYYFNIKDGDTLVDEEGTRLKDLHQAMIAAARLLGESLRDKPDEFWRDRELQIEVTDEAGLLLFAVNASAISAPATCSQ